ncbi:MAG: DUF3576 domain-containing protein [Alphaproteobacteria bacterium]|nr:DUF3576 domain-containing protein [Alphaproteobacteria bacterium]
MRVHTPPFRTVALLGSAACLMSVAACGGVEREAKYPTGADRSLTKDIYSEPESIFGPEGIRFLGGKDKKDNGEDGIGVNAYLWRAALDTVSFMPLESADPFGGAIITEWYSPPETPDERFKVNAFILSRELKSDGLRVRVFRQVKKSGDWKDAEVANDTATKLEDSILARARELRVAGLGG